MIKTYSVFVKHPQTGKRHHVFISSEGTIQFAHQKPQYVKDPGTYHYDNGGCLYQAACDAWRKKFDQV